MEVAAACLLAQVGFGAYPVIVAWSARGEAFNMVVFSTYRDLLCAPLLLVAARLVERKLLIPASKQEWMGLMILGAAGIGGQQLCFILGAYYSSPATASIFQNMIPVWAMVFSILLKQEAPPNISRTTGKLTLAGMALSVAGAVVMNLGKEKTQTNGDPSSSGLYFLGTMFLLLNTSLTGLYLAMQKKLVFNAQSSSLQRWKNLPVNLTAYCYVFGFAVAFLTALVGYFFQLDVLQFGPDHPDTNTWIITSNEVIPLLYALLIPSALSYSLLSFANKKAPSSFVSSFWPFQVPVAIFLSAMTGFGTVSSSQILGGILIIVGLLSVCRSSYVAKLAVGAQADGTYSPLQGEDIEREEFLHEHSNQTN